MSLLFSPPREILNNIWWRQEGVMVARPDLPALGLFGSGLSFHRSSYCKMSSSSFLPGPIPGSDNLHLSFFPSPYWKTLPGGDLSTTWEVLNSQNVLDMPRHVCFFHVFVNLFLFHLVTTRPSSNTFGVHQRCWYADLKCLPYKMFSPMRVWIHDSTLFESHNLQALNLENYPWTLHSVCSLWLWPQWGWDWPSVTATGKPHNLNLSFWQQPSLGIWAKKPPPCDALHDAKPWFPPCVRHKNIRYNSGDNVWIWGGSFNVLLYIQHLRQNLASLKNICATQDILSEVRMLWTWIQEQRLGPASVLAL